MIHERWKQFLFGFYPSNLYWRPTLAFVLLLVALAPVLFSERAAQAALVLGSPSPASAYWLLWGGSLCVPIVDLRRLRSSAGSAARLAGARLEPDRPLRRGGAAR